MDIKKEILIIKKQTELQREDRFILTYIDNLKLKDITKEFVFELLRMFVGVENSFYSLLLIDNLTFVSNGKNDNIRYVYPWGSSLIQIFFWQDEGILKLSVKLLS